jgi:hypothetical protein
MKLSSDTTLLPVQCDPTKYTIYLQVMNGGTGLNTSLPTPTLQNYTTRYGTTNCYIQYNYDDLVDANDVLIWQPTVPQTVAYTDSAFNFKVDIPFNSFIESVKVRLTHPPATCGSDFGVDQTDFDSTEMRLPLVPLIIDTNPPLNIENLKQCLPNKVSFKFNVSHLSIFQTFRAPYTLKYFIANQSGVFNATEIIHTTLITQNQQLITLTVPNLPPSLGGGSPTSATIKLTLTDNVGCVSPQITIGPIQIPTNDLNVNWTSTLVSGPANAPSSIYKKEYLIVGGIPPYTTPFGQPLLPVPYTTPSASANVALNNGLTITVLDSVGCLITKNSG